MGSKKEDRRNVFKALAKKLEKYYNPFIWFKDRELLVIGLVLFIVGPFLGYALNARFNGAIEVNFYKEVHLQEVFIDNTLGLLCLLICLFIAAKILDAKLSWVSFVATILLSRFPLYLITLTNIGGLNFNSTEEINKMAQGLETSYTTVSPTIIKIFIGLWVIACLAWMISILYIGYKKATQITGSHLIIALISAIVVAEIASKFLLRYL